MAKRLASDSPNDVFFELSRGVPGLARNAMSPPEVAFADPVHIRSAESARYESGKIFLGVIDGTVQTGQAIWGGTERYLTGGHEIGFLDDRHMLTVAGTRAGKGRSAIIPNMLRYPGSVLAIDPKGELARITARARAEVLGQDVYIVDPFGVSGGTLDEYRSGFNPLSAISEDSLVEDAALIADALVVPDRGGDAHWTDSARTLIEATIMLVRTSPVFAQRRNLKTVYELVGEGLRLETPATGETAKSPMQLFEIALRECPVDAVRISGADFFDRPERERGSVLSTARRQLRPIALPEIAASLSSGALELGTLKSGPATVYLCLPGRHLGTCGRWLRLFVNQALQAMERNPHVPAHPVLFLLDEFAALGPMGQIEDAAGQIAGYGVKLWPILQDLGQLKALYKDRWETFMGNAGILQFFGNSDLTTLEWISKRLGKTAVEVEAKSDVTPNAARSGVKGESFSTQLFNLLEPEGIALAFGRADRMMRQLIIRPGYEPMILQRAYYDKHETFRRWLR